VHLTILLPEPCAYLPAQRNPDTMRAVWPVKGWPSLPASSPHTEWPRVARRSAARH